MSYLEVFLKHFIFVDILVGCEVYFIIISRASEFNYFFLIDNHHTKMRYLMKNFQKIISNPVNTFC